MYKPRNGITLVELLVVLAISALLMAAVAAAFNASVVNYTSNQQIQQTVNKARQALTRITTQLRTADYVDPYAPQYRCLLKTSDGQQMSYEYRSNTKALYLLAGTGKEYLLCDNIADMSFAKTATADGTNCLAVRIAVTVQAGGLRQTFSTATAIRKNLGK